MREAEIEEARRRMETARSHYEFELQSMLERLERFEASMRELGNVVDLTGIRTFAHSIPELCRRKLEPTMKSRMETLGRALERELLVQEVARGAVNSDILLERHMRRDSMFLRAEEFDLFDAIDMYEQAVSYLVDLALVIGKIQLDTYTRVQFEELRRDVVMLGDQNDALTTHLTDLMLLIYPDKGSA